ncbi:MAG: outer membrane lipoprotein-sorting protein [Myxococcota bacterium]
MLRSTLAAALVTLAAGPAAAADVSPDETDPRTIMDAVDDRPTGDRSLGRMKMVIIDANGSKRVRLVRTRSMEFDESTRQLLLFESPADVRNTGLLTIDWDEGDKSDDQWLYLPSLRKSTRISSGEKSGSFMGSDLTFHDMTRRATDQYDYEMLKQSARVKGEPAWLIGVRPRTDRAKEESGYVKSKVWISKSKLVPLQAKHWVREGRKLKYMKFQKYRKVDGILVAHEISARTVQGDEVLSTTILTLSDLSFDNEEVSEADFTQRRLEQGL